MTVQQTVALIVFLFPLAYSPGPGNMYFAANGARFGLRATIPANVGYHIATWLVTLGIGFGFALALQRLPTLFTIIKVAGSLYVLWLAWKLFRAGVLDKTQEAEPTRFVDGVVLLLLNPKAYFIIALMFSQFLQAQTGDQFTTVLWISTIFTANNLVAFIVWAMIGDRISQRFRSKNNAKTLNAVLGITLAAVAVWMLLS